MPDPTKTYPSPFPGRILLACRKCRKKLKGDERLSALARLKKTIQRLNRKHPDRPLALVETTCMDLCPKRGVTICDPAAPDKLYILWNEKDLERFAR